jgi:ketosteroid isomerase-like protein
MGGYMKSRWSFLLLGVMACGHVVGAGDDAATRVAELDALWATIAKAVATGDFKTYAKTCHPDGVLVSGRRQRTEPLSSALKRWEKEFDATREGRMTASASLRFATRYGDETTAYEVGILRYAFKPVDGEETVEYVDIEVVLVKQADGWKVICENQKGLTTKEAWDALEAPTAQ